jgi:hypothetical protein
VKQKSRFEKCRLASRRPFLWRDEADPASSPISPAADGRAPADWGFLHHHEARPLKMPNKALRAPAGGEAVLERQARLTAFPIRLSLGDRRNSAGDRLCGSFPVSLRAHSPFRRRRRSPLFLLPMRRRATYRVFLSILFGRSRSPTDGRRELSAASAWINRITYSGQPH